MGDVVLLVRIQSAPGGRVAVPRWAARGLGLDRGAWRWEVLPGGRVVLRRGPDGPEGNEDTGPETPPAA